MHICIIKQMVRRGAMVVFLQQRNAMDFESTGAPVINL
jgi:hypothetical protein